MHARSFLKPLCVLVLLAVWPTGQGFATGEARAALYQSVVEGYYSKFFEATGGLPPRGQAEAVAECVTDLTLAGFSPDEMGALDTSVRTNAKMPAQLESKWMARYREMLGEMGTASTCFPIATPEPAND